MCDVDGKKPLRIAIYGKGGIGKSTVSSNITYSFASRGVRVLQIGCDPKHDSTRSLLNGKTQTTVLDALRDGSGGLDDIQIKAPCGADCIESGGPEPGIGCAGRGIITAINQLHKLGLRESDYGLIVYDVLGDVVCGGFAVPLRIEYSDAIYLVTSGEYMSVYAANNILRGALNHSPEVPRIGGIILNRKNLEGEDDLVERFAEAVGLPIIARLSRDELYAEAEREGKTVCERFPDSGPSEEYKVLMNAIEQCMGGKAKLHHPRPLNDDDLDSILRGKKISPAEEAIPESRIKVRTKSHEACAARGAASAASNVRDLTVVIHGPRSCGYVMANIWDVHYLGKVKTNGVVKRGYKDNVYCTDMDDSDAIFGGIRKLESLLRRLYSEGKKTFMIITACIPGVIGDDVESCLSRLRAELADADLMFVKADGNISGDVIAGIRRVRENLAELIDTDVQPVRGVTNLIYSAGMGNGPDMRQVIELLDCVGFELGAILFNECTIEEIRNAKRAQLTIPMSSRDMISDIPSLLESKGMAVGRDPIPKGVEETVSWVRSLENEHNHDRVEKYIADGMAEYGAAIERSIGTTRGKTVYLASRMSPIPGWALEVFRDLEMRIVRMVVTPIGPMPEGVPTEPEGGSPVWMTTSQVREDLRALDPDLYLGDQRQSEGLGIRCGFFPDGSIGFRSSTDLVQYIANIFRTEKPEPVHRGVSS